MHTEASVLVLLFLGALPALCAARVHHAYLLCDTAGRPVVALVQDLDTVERLMDRVYNGIFVHRYRDVSDEVRRDTIAALGTPRVRPVERQRHKCCMVAPCVCARQQAGLLIIRAHECDTSGRCRT